MRAGDRYRPWEVSCGEQGGLVWFGLTISSAVRNPEAFLCFDLFFNLLFFLKQSLFIMKNHNLSSI